MQLKTSDNKDIQLVNVIKEIGKGGFVKIYSTIWRVGPLYWNKKEYIRDFN